MFLPKPALSLISRKSGGISGGLIFQSVVSQSLTICEQKDQDLGHQILALAPCQV